MAFGADGAQSLTMSIANAGETGTVEVYIDDHTKTENKVGELTVTPTGSDTTFADMSVNFAAPITGTHRLFFVFKAKGILVDTWRFSKEIVPGPAV